MKRFVIAFVIIASFAAACGGGKNKQKEDQKDTPTTNSLVSKNSEEFNQSFGKVLNDYYSLKDALVASDSVKASVAATKLAADADSLDINALIDSTGAIHSTAFNLSGTISGSARSLAGEKTIEAKRKEFQMISDAMYDLVRTARFDKQKMYHQFCPMAFNNEGAYWLSQQKEIKNPYFGEKMLTCGETQDVLDFASNAGDKKEE